MLLLSGAGTVAPTLLSTGCDVPSSKQAHTYSQPCDVSLRKLCAKLAKNGPVGWLLDDHDTPVITTASSCATATASADTVTLAEAKDSSRMYTCDKTQAAPLGVRAHVRAGASTSAQRFRWHAGASGAAHLLSSRRVCDDHRAGGKDMG